MHPQQGATDRYFIDCRGVDDEALSMALEWLFHEVERRQIPGHIVTYAKGNAENLERVLPEEAVKALISGRRLSVHGQTVSLVTISKGLPPSLRGSVVLAVWLDDDKLSKVDDEHPSAVCLVPWNPEYVQKWLVSWSPADIRTGKPYAGPQAPLSPVVAAALRSLANSVNLSTGLVHPDDRDHAIHTFRALLHGKERIDPLAIRAWAVQNGWSAEGADELQKVVQDVLAGKRLRTRSKSDDPILLLEYWRREAAAGE